MIRCLGSVEVDETYLGGKEEGVHGRALLGKALVVIAVELSGRQIGRVRLRHVPDASGESLIGFVSDCVEPGTKVHTDGWLGYAGLDQEGYRHKISPISGSGESANKLYSCINI